jgi:hypothetical protein
MNQCCLHKSKGVHEGEREIRPKWPAIYTFLKKERGRFCHHEEGFELCPVALSCLIARQERERASAQVCILDVDTRRVSTMWRYNEDLCCVSSTCGHNEDTHCVDTTS